ncbi:MAG: FAD-binding protein [Chloroflexota bacterium]|nr:MAG: FAD-binding protein [Chloroflexota bacterium]
MADQFQYLFSPLKIGPVTVRNRIAIAPHSTLFAPRGMPSDRLAFYYAERAKGGAGLITVEACITGPGPARWPLIKAYDERSIPGLRKVADMVHEHGATCFCELINIGVWGGLGASMMPDLWTRSTAREATVAEIEEWVEQYGRSARHLVEAGMDGVEIHASHGAGPQQFNSPLYNKRTDKYGGSLEKRLTFLLESVHRIRQEIGPTLALGVRLDVDEMIPGGVTLEDGQEIARILENTGEVDYLSVDTAMEPHQQHFMTAPMYVAHGHMVFAAAAVKDVLDKIPVIAAGRIIDPLHAEKILADGQADMVAMTRAQIADPELANKARAGRLEDIRPCLGDNENCIGRLQTGAPVACTVNPAVGVERFLGLGTLQPATAKKKVLVVGGGVAGMETARVAALRGHQVALYEKAETLGGQVNLASRLPGRSEVEGIARWLEGQLDQLDVDIHLGEEVTADKVDSLKPDAVVVATGAAYFRNGLCGQTLSPIEGWEQENVATPEEILTGAKIAGQRVVIVDETGYLVGLGLSEWLADQGKEVEIVTSDPFVGSALVPNLQLPWVYARIMGKVTLTPHTRITQIADQTLTAINVHSYEERQIEDVDTVILVTGKAPDDSLFRALEGRVPELHLVGDANIAISSVFGIGDAVRNAHQLGRQI